MSPASRPSRTRPVGVAALALVAATAIGGPAAPDAADAARRAPCPAATAEPGTVPAPALARATVCLVNRIRVARGRPALRPNRHLALFARSYSRRMVRGGFFGHDVPGGPSFRRRAAASAYARASARMRMGENLAWGTGRLASPARIVTAWMRSPGHRANILNPRFRDLGVWVVPVAPRAGYRDYDAATYVHAFGVRRLR